MSKFIYPMLFIAAISLPSARADIVVNFVESAPKDRFVIENTSECDFENLIVEIDLTGSVGRLIFDTTATGAGVEVFQPFEVREGDVRLLSENQVHDGERMLSVGIKKLSPDTSVSFTIDVDDTLPKSELGNIRVTGSEILDGRVNVSHGDGPVSSALFSTQSVAVVPTPECRKQ